MFNQTNDFIIIKKYIETTTRQEKKWKIYKARFYTKIIIDELHEKSILLFIS